MGTCILCTCLVGSVYCDDLKLGRVPPLPKETTHFYARYNKISRIGKSDFANLSMCFIKGTVKVFYHVTVKFKSI